MNEHFAFDLARQKHQRDLAQAQVNINRAGFPQDLPGRTRDRLALALVALATRLQPSLAIEIRRPARPALA